MHILAHRGVSAHYHENTMLAFEKAIEINVYGIEVDLHQVENEFVIFHDFNLDRLVKTRADLADLSIVQISELRLDKKYSIPLLDDLFALTQGKVMLNLELKYIREPAVLVNKIQEYIYQYNGQLVISSFNHPLLVSLQGLLRNTRILHNIKFAALIGHLPLDLAQYAVDLQVDIAAIDADLVNKDFVEHAHIHHLAVWTYTVNNEKTCRKLKAMGVDAIFSNDPELLKRYCE